MRTFQIYVEDDRYSVPTLHVATLTGEDRAMEIAERLLAESEHHIGVEVAEDGRRLFGLGALDHAATPRANDRDGREMASGE